MTRLDTVFSFVSLSLTWDRLNSNSFVARDRNNCKLTVKQSSISSDFVDEASTRSCRG